MRDDKERVRNSAKICGVGVYPRILENAQTNLRALLKKRQEIDEQMRSLQRITNTVLAACEEDGVSLPPDLVLPFDEDVPLSISLIDAVRTVLKQSGDLMSVAEVSDRLIAMELDLHKLWKPTALVRETLKRLLERGEVSGDPPDKPVRFRWFDPTVPEAEPDPLLSLIRPRPKDWLKKLLESRRRAGLLQ